MTIPNRDVTITGVFAEDASTTIPSSPISGTSYRNSSMTAEDVEEGFPYKTVVDSANFNQAMYEYSSVTKQVEKYGFLPWSNLTDYETGSICLGSDGNLYQAQRTTGPSTIARDPTTDTGHTYWNPYFQSVMATMLSSIYPVGSVYMGTMATNPMATLIPGSTWEQIEGKYILASGALAGIEAETYPAGGSVTAGIPDHRHYIANGSRAPQYTKPQDGTMGDSSNTMGNNDYSLCGFSDTTTYPPDTFLTSKTTYVAQAGSLAGNARTIRPAAYVVNVWRRTA